MGDQNNFDQEIDRIKKVYVERDNRGLSRQYTYNNPAFIFHVQEREREILKVLRDNQFNLDGKKILEVGCGTGHILNRFLEFGAKDVWGIELIKKRVVEAQQLYPRIHITEGDASHLPYENNSFDLVMQFMCLSSVLDQAMRYKIALEMWRVLKPGGAVLWYDLCPLLKPLEGTIQFYNHRALSTPIRKIPLNEVNNLFPNGISWHKKVSLILKLGNLSSKSYLLSYLFSLCPIFRTHYLVFIKKPN